MTNPYHPATSGYPRDLVGYGRTPPHAAWPGGARIAVQCVLKYEEGAEANILDGDPSAAPPSRVRRRTAVAGQVAGIAVLNQMHRQAIMLG